ncbi:hypothetical protein ACFE04_017176 [Oxalis oulophora]
MENHAQENHVVNNNDDEVIPIEISSECSLSDNGNPSSSEESDDGSSSDSISSDDDSDNTFSGGDSEDESSDGTNSDRNLSDSDIDMILRWWLLKMYLVQKGSELRISLKNKLLDLNPFLDSDGDLSSHRLLKLTYERSLLVDDIFSDPTKFKTINYIKEYQEEGVFITYGKVEKIDETNGWCYNSCQECRKKVFETSDGLLCNKCGGEPKFVVPRYKIELWISDPSGFATFVLFDQQATKLLGGTDIVPYGYEPIPMKLQSLIKKSFLFKVKKNDFNINTQIHSYTVQNMIDKDDLISKMLKNSDVKEMLVEYGEAQEIQNGDLIISESKELVQEPLSIISNQITTYKRKHKSIDSNCRELSSTTISDAKSLKHSNYEEE